MRTLTTSTGVKMLIVDNDNLYNKELETKLKQINPNIYWSNDRLIHYFVDFKINNIWVECREVDLVDKTISISLFK